MSSEEMRKKWGTIFMGEREASVEQLNAMQESLRREKQQKEQAGDYMERVRTRATERAREILGQAYTERQKVLDEAAEEAAARKREAASECARLKAEGDAARKLAQAELARAREELEQAEKIREGAHSEGFQAGMDQAAADLHEFRAEMGNSLAAILHALERQRRAILENWRAELAELTRCAVEAGTGYVLNKEHEAILRSLVFQSLDLLENRSTITLKVNPADEEAVSGMFRAARDRFPELKQWVVIGDEKVEQGGLVAESGSGSVDLKRDNFRQMVDGILCHLGLPDAGDPGDSEAREIVEREVAHIASLTPEPDRPPVSPQPEPAAPPSADQIQAQAEEEPLAAALAGEEESEPALETVPETENAEREEALENSVPPELNDSHMADSEDLAAAGELAEPLEPEPLGQEAEAAPEPDGERQELLDLEEELFPLEGEEAGAAGPEESAATADTLTEDAVLEDLAPDLSESPAMSSETSRPVTRKSDPDADIFTEGGFL